jgi:uncharacterized membrane protein
VSPNVFVLVLGIGSGLLAAWAGVRFPKLAPRDLSRIMLHLLVATAAATFLVPKLIDAAISRGFVLEAVFLIALPALVYCMLVGFWMLRFLSGKLGELTHR